MSIPKFCRICFNEAKTFVSLYDETQLNDSTIASLIMECSSVQLRLFDSNYPEQICLECLRELEGAINFRRRCLMSEKLLNEHLNKHFQTSIKPNDNDLADDTFLDNCNSFDEKHNDEDFVQTDGLTKRKEINDAIKSTKSSNIEKNTLINNNRRAKQSVERIKLINSKPRTKRFNVERITLINSRRPTKISNVERIKLKNSRPPSYSLNRNSMEKTACLFCEKIFDGRKLWRIHLLEHRNNGVITCPKENCCSSFKKIKSFEIHISDVHSNRQFICPHCGVILLSMTSWRHHIRRKHLKIFPHKCTVCAKAFIVPGLLKQHILRIHSDQRDFACDKCGKKFATVRSHKKHTELHDDPSRFHCPHCPNSYTKKQRFHAHIRTHGPNAYQCTCCSKSYVLKRHLQRHMCTHTGERPVACKLCDKRFTQHTSLYWHLKTRHENYKPTNEAIITKN